MIRSLLKRTKFHRAALMLLAMLLTTPVWAEALPETKDNVEYIGENGELKTANNVTVLDADDDDEPTIGESNTETWYYVNDKEIFNSINIEGTVNIILGDNADLTSYYIYGGADTKLNIYGTGKLATKSSEESLCSGDISIYGGTISAISTDGPAILGYNSVNIYGGKITATSISTYNDDGIRLGWILPDDYINVSNYGGNVTILPGKEFYYNGTETFSSDKNISNDDIKGKKLQPVVASISIDGSNETIYSCLTEKESVFNRSDHDVNIKLLTDANFYGSQIIFDNNNSETEGETTQNTKITLNLNGHTLTGKFTKMEGGYLNVYPVILVEKKANVEITDLSEGKGGTFNVIYCISNDGTLSVSNVSFFLKDKEGTSILNYGTLSVSNVSFISKNEGKAFIKNYGLLSVSNTKFDCKNADANNVTQGIYTDENSTLNIGSGVRFSNLKYGIYTHYNEEQDPWRARAMTRGSETEKEPAKLYINALPVFENCLYDIFLHRSIMDFSNATAPLTLASGQKRITFTYETNVPGIVCTKGYKHAFTDPETGTITNPNDIFNYKVNGSDGSLYYIDDESYCYIPGAGLSSVITDASGAITYRGQFDNSNTGISFKNTLDNLENGGTVQLFSDITGATKPYVINKGTAEDPVTLDLNGHTITGDLTVESGCKLMLIDSSNGKGHIKGAISVPVDALQNCLTNWSEKADTIKSTGKIKTDYVNNQTWTLTKTDGDKIDGNFPLKLTIEGDGIMGDFYWQGAPWYAVHSYITEASLPKGLSEIGGYAFMDCAITSITIPALVTELDYAFYNCKKLANVTFKGNITEIGDNAFNGCTSLKEISLPNSVTKIGGNAFCRSGLTRITIPSLVSEIPQSAFSNCESLAEVIIPEGVEKIDWAFDGCTSLTEISIPSSVTSIGQNSFYGCTALKTVRINSTTATCDYRAFMDCTSLERIIVPNATTIAKYLEDEYFNYYNGDKICAEGYCGVDDANDGKNVKWSLMPIADEYINFGSEQDPDERQAYALTITKNTDAENANLAMKDCPEDNNWYDGDDPYSISRRIKTATIEKGITNIGTWAFSKCINLESVAVPSTVAAIGEYAFYNCKKLACVNIPEGVTTIGEWTFESCESLTSVDNPSTVTNIDERAFGGCTSLKTIRVKATTPPTIEKYGSIETIAPFYNCTSLKNIFVPDVDAYSKEYGWKEDYILPLLRADKTTLFAQDASNTYMTWCDEFEWKKPEGCTVYTVSGVNSEQVQVAEVEGDVIPAYTPVLIHRAEGKLTADIKAEFSNVVENVSTSGTSYNEIDKDYRANEGTVIASYDGGCVYGNTGAVLNPKNDGLVVNDEYTSTYALYGDKFLMIDADEGIPTHRFIMRVSHKNDDALCARSLTIGVGGDTTGMEELKNEKIEELNSEWYDLQGRKLGSKPTRKGLYINNGKKIVIK